MHSIQNFLAGRGFRPLFAWLTRGGAGWLLVAAGCFALVGGVTLYFSWDDITYSRSGYFEALTGEFEETKGANKGLEAFVLSGFGTDVATMFSENNVTDGFIDAFNKLEEELKPPEPPGKSGATPTPTPKEALNLEVIPPGRSELPLTAKFLTNKDGLGFLFIPGTVVGAWVPANAGDKAILEAVEREDSALRHVVLNSKEVAPFLNLLRDTEVVGDNGRGKKQTLIGAKPVQTYFLTSTGLLRIDGREVRNYRPQFPPYTFFPERPYFWATIDPFDGATELQRGSQYKLDRAFHTTKPYIDYGGNGIVVTLSRPVEEAAVKSGLFLDFVLGEYAENSIKKKIERLHGTWDELSWVAKDPEPEVTPKEGRMPEEAQTALKVDIQRWRSKLAEISGKLHLISSKEGVVEFTVPIPVVSTVPGNADAQPQPSSGRLLYCRLDLEGFQQRVLRNVIIIASSLALFAFCVVIFVIYSHRERKKQEAENRRRLEEQEAEARRKLEEQKTNYSSRLEEQEQAFKRFGRVMADASVAYTRLDEHDEFIEMNREFAALLGYESLESAWSGLGKGQTFEGLLADKKSRLKYEDIREMRRKHLHTGPYRVRLRGKDGEPVAVRVYGAGVPKPGSQPKSVPETFGIVEKDGAAPGEMSVKPRFGLPKELQSRLDLFVIMPLASAFGEVYKSIKDIAERMGLEAKRGDESSSAQPVMPEVWMYINAARLIIADCTGRNANVFYEIGLAHVLGKTVIFITQNKDDIPFDIIDLRYILYNKDTWGEMRQLQQQLEESIKAELGPGAK